MVMCLLYLCTKLVMWLHAIMAACCPTITAVALVAISEILVGNIMLHIAMHMHTYTVGMVLSQCPVNYGNITTPWLTLACCDFQ